MGYAEALYEDMTDDDEVGGGDTADYGDGGDDEDNPHAGDPDYDPIEDPDAPDADEDAPSGSDDDGEDFSDAKDNAGVEEKLDNSAPNNLPAPAAAANAPAAKKGGKKLEIVWSLAVFADLWAMMKDKGTLKKIPGVAQIIKIKETIENIMDAMAMAGGFFPWLWGKVQGGLSFMLGSNPKKKIIDVVIDILKGSIIPAILFPIQSLFEGVVAVVKPILDMVGNMINSVKDTIGKDLKKYPALAKQVLKA